jgi:uncharacterized cupin superfamily protein
MDVFNLNGDEWDREEDRPGWRSKDASIGRRLGGELIGASLYELEPGNTLWPYHTHHANEEWLLVVRGRPTLRYADGEQELTEGDVACFRRGKDGFHQVKNATDEPVRADDLDADRAEDRRVRRQREDRRPQRGRRADPPEQARPDAGLLGRRMSRKPAVSPALLERDVAVLARRPALALAE